MENVSKTLQNQIKSLINLFHAGQMTEVVQACRQLLKTSPHSLAVINILGAALQALGKLEEAVGAFDKAIQLKPDSAETHSNRGVALNDLGKFEEALESCEKAIRLKPDFAEAYSNRGNTLRNLGRVNEALESCDTALKLKPDLPAIHIIRGAILKELGQLSDALAEYDKAIQFNPNSAEAYTNHGATLQDLGQLNEALASYEQALVIDPNSIAALNNSGSALKKLGQIDKALKRYKRAISISPYENISNYELATIFLKSRKFEQAIHHYRQSKHKDWEENILLCLYKLERYRDFKSLLHRITNKGKVSPLLATLSQHYSQNFKVEIPYNFCNSPLDYVLHKQVPELIENKGQLTKDLLHDIKHAKIATRTQGLLTSGTQSSGNLLNRPEISFNKLSLIIKKMIQQYYESHRNIDNQFIKYFPKHIEFLNSWYIKIQSGGYLRSHIHEHSWISGAVYLVIPESATNSTKGAIELSTHGDDYPKLHNRFTTEIIPLRTGDIVFFPSSVFHRTTPFVSNEERICIAFDIKTDLSTRA